MLIASMILVDCGVCNQSVIVPGVEM